MAKKGSSEHIYVCTYHDGLRMLRIQSFLFPFHIKAPSSHRLKAFKRWENVTDVQWKQFSLFFRPPFTFQIFIAVQLMWWSEYSVVPLGVWGMMLGIPQKYDRRMIVCIFSHLHAKRIDNILRYSFSVFYVAQVVSSCTVQMGEWDVRGVTNIPRDHDKFVNWSQYFVVPQFAGSESPGSLGLSDKRRRYSLTSVWDRLFYLIPFLFLLCGKQLFTNRTLAE